MKEYEVKTGPQVFQALEALETTLDSIKELEMTVCFNIALSTITDEKSAYLEHIKSIFEPLNFECQNNYEFLNYKLDSFNYNGENLARPLNFFDIILFIDQFIVQAKRRIKRRIERLKKTISRRFVDYRVFIRSFASKVVRRNTEEESVLCGLDKIKLTFHIDNFPLWTKNIFQN